MPAPAAPALLDWGTRVTMEGQPLHGNVLNCWPVHPNSVYLAGLDYPTAKVLWRDGSITLEAVSALTVAPERSLWAQPVATPGR